MNADIEPEVEVPDELRAQQAALRNGEKPRAKVRELLSWFDAARRGFVVVRRVRAALDAVDLVTWPDFEGEYIDQEVFFMDKASFRPPKPAPPVPATEGAAPVVATAAVVPSHRLGRLKAANRRPVSVSPAERLEAATTLMLTHDFSQLPVMQSDRSVKGIISWKSIGSKLALGRACAIVQDCMEQHHELRDDASLFDAIGIIAEHDCVLVRDRENKVTGLVTGADISEQFHVLAEPFLLLGDIENRIRALILPRFSTDELRAVRLPSDGGRAVEGVSDLTFGEYVRLLENEERWNKLQLRIDRSKFVEQLGRIREIRNDVMHFDPDGIDEGDLGELRSFSNFLDRLEKLTG
ncbi:MAG TPA: CBS domain-containing protein [Pirellulales bacterium]|nr:CBS domain-containing protein [Pirellulales bacterium]